MNILDLLDRPIAYHRVFVTLTGSVKAAVLLSQAVYWQKRATQKDGWWYKTAEEWEEETGLSRHEQDTARRDCEPYLSSDLRGIPATLYWKVNEEELTNALIQFGGKRQTRKTKTDKQDSEKQSNINKNTETNTETTTDIKKEKPDFKSLSPEKYRTIPELKTFIDATGWIPGSFVLEVVYDFVNKGLTREQITAAFSEWTARGYNPANVKGYLTWARDGIPEAYSARKDKNANKGIVEKITDIVYSAADIAAAERIKARRAGL